MVAACHARGVPVARHRSRNNHQGFQLHQTILIAPSHSPSTASVFLVIRPRWMPFVVRSTVLLRPTARQAEPTVQYQLVGEAPLFWDLATGDWSAGFCRRDSFQTLTRGWQLASAYTDGSFDKRQRAETSFERGLPANIQNRRTSSKNASA